MKYKWWSQPQVGLEFFGWEMSHPKYLWARVRDKISYSCVILILIVRVRDKSHLKCFTLIVSLEKLRLLLAVLVLETLAYLFFLSLKPWWWRQHLPVMILSAGTTEEDLEWRTFVDTNHILFTHFRHGTSNKDLAKAHGCHGFPTHIEYPFTTCLVEFHWNDESDLCQSWISHFHCLVFSFCFHKIHYGSLISILGVPSSDQFFYFLIFLHWFPGA